MWTTVDSPKGRGQYKSDFCLLDDSTSQNSRYSTPARQVRPARLSRLARHRTRWEGCTGAHRCLVTEKSVLGKFGQAWQVITPALLFQRIQTRSLLCPVLRRRCSINSKTSTWLVSGGPTLSTSYSGAIADQGARGTGLDRAVSHQLGPGCPSVDRLVRISIRRLAAL